MGGATDAEGSRGRVHVRDGPQGGTGAAVVEEDGAPAVQVLLVPHGGHVAGAGVAGAAGRVVVRVNEVGRVDQAAVDGEGDGAEGEQLVGLGDGEGLVEAHVHALQPLQVGHVFHGQRHHLRGGQQLVCAHHRYDRLQVAAVPAQLGHGGGIGRKLLHLPDHLHLVPGLYRRGGGVDEDPLRGQRVVVLVLLLLLHVEAAHLVRTLVGSCHDPFDQHLLPHHRAHRAAALHRVDFDQGEVVVEDGAGGLQPHRCPDAAHVGDGHGKGFVVFRR